VSVIDIAIVVLVGLSCLVSLLRGFFKEAVSLLSWVAAILITLMFTSRFSGLLPADSIESPTARATVSAVILFFSCLLLGAIANWLFQKIVATSRLGFVDRFVGILFGAARGGIIVALLVLAAHLVPTLKQEAWWRSSLLIPHFQGVAQFIHAQLPGEIAQHFDLSPASIAN